MKGGLSSLESLLNSSGVEPKATSPFSRKSEVAVWSVAVGSVIPLGNVGLNYTLTSNWRRLCGGYRTIRVRVTVQSELGYHETEGYRTIRVMIR